MAVEMLKYNIDEETIYNLRIKGQLKKLQQQLRLIDLFAGAGGLSLGFTETVMEAIYGSG